MYTVGLGSMDQVKDEWSNLGGNILEILTSKYKANPQNTDWTKSVCEKTLTCLFLDCQASSHTKLNSNQRRHDVI